ncbi:MAG: DUF2163 domain-containing protein [Hyphomonadaceae bacterium]|nr:DUF2163 domain-containing protein [Hyphomonadaceae bacterium]
MRDIPEELAARIATGVTSLATIWKLTRRDEAVFGFTDHDRTLSIEGVDYEPASGFAPGVIEKSLGLGVDAASAAGALSSDAIGADDLANGLWDGARVDIWRVDWTDPDLKAHLFAGRLGEVRRGARAFEAELRGLQAQLNKPVGRVFARFCDADLGDARCGMDLETAAFRGEGEIADVLSGNGFVASGLGAFADGWFSDGRIVWAAGGVSEVSVHRQSALSATIELVDARTLEAGAAFVIYAGCDKRIETCRAKFANAVNFRGFPHMPGNDALQAGPEPGGDNDGGSRA